MIGLGVIFLVVSALWHPVSLAAEVYTRHRDRRQP